MQQMQPGVVAAGKFHGPAGRRIACFGVADHRMQIHRHFLLAENVACHGHACGYAPVVLGVHRYERSHFSKNIIESLLGVHKHIAGRGP